MPIQKGIPPKVAHPKLKDIPRLPMPPETVHYVGEPTWSWSAVSRLHRRGRPRADRRRLRGAAGGLVHRASRWPTGAPLVHAGADGQRRGACSSSDAGDPDAGSRRGAAPAVGAVHHHARRRALDGDPRRRRPLRRRHRAAHRLGHHAVPALRAQHAVLPVTTCPRTTSASSRRPTWAAGSGRRRSSTARKPSSPGSPCRSEHPVKWIEDRQENFVSTMMERAQVHDVEIGFDDDGRILVIKDVFKHDQGAYCAGLQVPMITLSTLPGPYRIPNIHTELSPVYTNMVPTSSVRGAGRPQAVVRDGAHDRPDRRAPRAWTRPKSGGRNLIQPDEFPYQVGLTFRDGSPLTYDSGNYPLLLQAMLDELGYERARTEQARLREAGRYRRHRDRLVRRGLRARPVRGCADPADQQRQVPRDAGSCGTGPGLRDRVRADRLRRDRCRHGPDQGPDRRHQPDPVRAGHLRLPDDRTAGPAVSEAGKLMGDKVRTVAAVLLAADVEDLVFDADDRSASRGDREQAGQPAGDRPDRQRRQARHHAANGASQPGLETSAYFAPERAAYASGAHVAVVEVDPETGDVTSSRT